MEITIPEAIKQLLQVVTQLQYAYPKRKFTLDGRLVGDLGEVLAEVEYDIELYDGLQKHHDAKASDGRQVQIKATMKDSLTFPADHVPDYYLGIKIEPDGTLTEIFNGPGSVAYKVVKDWQRPKTNLHSVSVNALKRLNEEVHPRDKIPRRSRKPV